MDLNFPGPDHYSRTVLTIQIYSKPTPQHQGSVGPFKTKKNGRAYATHTVGGVKVIYLVFYIHICSTPATD